MLGTLFSHAHTHRHTPRQNRAAHTMNMRVYASVVVCLENIYTYIVDNRYVMKICGSGIVTLRGLFYYTNTWNFVYMHMMLLASSLFRLTNKQTSHISDISLIPFAPLEFFHLDGASGQNTFLFIFELDGFCKLFSQVSPYLTVSFTMFTDFEAN